MSLEFIDDVERLKKINRALISRVESSMDQHGNAFSLFQTAISLEGQVKRRTDELTVALRQFEKTNAELEAAKEASEIANLSKTKFLAAASHDVLQPLNAALLSVSVLSDLQNTELGKELVQQVERSLETMSELLSTLLDISKLDAGIVKPRFEEFPLWQILDGIQSDFSPIADEKGLELRIRCDEFLAVRSDRTMLRRIFQNLISNALRYTSSGGVLIAIRKRRDHLQVEVVDTGNGIPDHQQQNVFEEFHRGALPNGHDREANSGLGLGLSIVKRLATTLGHELAMNSKVGRGTRFSLRVPRSDDVPALDEINEVQSAPVMAGIKNREVLLIENDPDGIAAMQTLLESWGCKTKIARTVDETIKLACSDDWVPDVIIADQNLDFGDLGTDAIQKVREFSECEIPALIITADPNKSVVQKAKKLGMEMMHKPIKPAQLRALLSHLAG